MLGNLFVSANFTFTFPIGDSSDPVLIDFFYRAAESRGPLGQVLRIGSKRTNLRLEKTYWEFFLGLY